MRKKPLKAMLELEEEERSMGTDGNLWKNGLTRSDRTRKFSVNLREKTEKTPRKPHVACCLPVNFYPK